MGYAWTEIYGMKKGTWKTLFCSSYVLLWCEKRILVKNCDIFITQRGRTYLEFLHYDLLWVSFPCYFSFPSISLLWVDFILSSSFNLALARNTNEMKQCRGISNIIYFFFSQAPLEKSCPTTSHAVINLQSWPTLIFAHVMILFVLSAPITTS